MEYQTKLPLVALRLGRSSLDHRASLTIPRGVTISVMDEPDGGGLVRANFQGEGVAVLQRDLDNRARRCVSFL